MKSISQKIIKNTTYNAIGRLWGIAIALILTPYIINQIGTERYGIWAIISVLTGYFGLMDFGIRTSFVKYISEYYTKLEFQKINEVVNTGFFFYTIFGIIITIISFIFINQILTLFGVPSDLYKEALFIFLLGIILFGISNATTVFGALQIGLQRMDISNKVSIAVTIPNAIGTFFFLEKGYGLYGLMFNNLIVLSLTIIINIIIDFRILPELKINPFFFSKKILKKLFNFGYKLQISRFASLVSFQTDKILISHFLGIGYVTFYQLGTVITHKMRELPLLLVSALVPAISEMAVNKDTDSLKNVYLIGSKYLILVSTPLLFFVLINSNLIIYSWMGVGFEKAAIVAQILAIGYYANTVSAVASAIAQGIAKTEFEMKFGIFLSVFNLILSITLIIKFGFLGVVIGTSLSLFLGTLIFLQMFHQYFNYSNLDFIQLFFKPVIACGLPSLLMIFSNYYILPKFIFFDRLLNIGTLILNGLLFFSIYLVTIHLNRYLDDFDTKLLKKKVPVLKYIL